MIGSNRDEWSLYFNGEADVDAWLIQETSAQDSKKLKSVLHDIDDPVRKLDLLITAKSYVCPSLKLADETRKNKMKKALKDITDQPISSDLSEIVNKALI